MQNKLQLILDLKNYTQYFNFFLFYLQETKIILLKFFNFNKIFFNNKIKLSNGIRFK